MRTICAVAVGPCLVCGLLSLAGCGEGDQIKTYPVPTASVGGTNDPAVPIAGGHGAPGASANVTMQPARMLVAMVEQGAQTWFFKLLGPVDTVGDHEQEFTAFVRSVQFSADKPTWSAPSGWSPQGQSGLRLETFHVGNHQPKLELTVIPLGTMAGGGDAAILDNLNRWRGQLQLSPIRNGQLADNIKRVQLQKGAEAVVMDLVGKVAAAGGSGRPPFAGGPMRNRGNTGGPTVSGPPTATVGNASSPISYETPKGWRAGKTTAFRKAAFNISDGDQKALVTVIPLPPSGTLANINRWRGQVGLGEITEDELKQQMHSITVDGIEGQSVDMVGEKQTILAAIVNRGGRAWFFKLQGDVDLARREKQRFQSFVKSVKFQ